MLRILDPSLAGQTAHAASVLPHRLGRTLPELCPASKRTGHWARRLCFRCYTFWVRKLIVNADDLGLTAGVDRAIVETHIGGVVSSATLMANGAAFADAVAASRSVPSLSVDCHVVLVDGTPVSPPDAVDTLLGHSFGRSGKVLLQPLGLRRARMLGGFDRDQLVAKITAQIRKIQSAGIHVTHLDTHKHAHISRKFWWRCCGPRAFAACAPSAIPSFR